MLNTTYWVRMMIGLIRIYKKKHERIKGVEQFKKNAVEANATNQRLSALYEDMGNILNRYYEIDEEWIKLTKTS